MRSGAVGAEHVAHVVRAEPALRQQVDAAAEPRVDPLFGQRVHVALRVGARCHDAAGQRDAFAVGTARAEARHGSADRETDQGADRIPRAAASCVTPRGMLGSFRKVMQNGISLPLA